VGDLARRTALRVGDGGIEYEGGAGLRRAGHLNDAQDRRRRREPVRVLWTPSRESRRPPPLSRESKKAARRAAGCRRTWK